MQKPAQGRLRGLNGFSLLGHLHLGRSDRHSYGDRMAELARLTPFGVQQVEVDIDARDSGFLGLLAGHQ